MHSVFSWTLVLLAGFAVLNGAGDFTADKSIYAEDKVVSQEAAEAVSSGADLVSDKTPVNKEDYELEWEELLDQPVTLNVTGLSIADVLEQLEEKWGKAIIVHSSVWDSHGDLDSFEVKRNFEKISARQVLKILLSPQQLTYATEDDHLVILTEEESENNIDFLKLRMYDVRDYLLATVPEVDGERCRKRLAKKAESLMRLVANSGGHWEITGEGSGTISAHDGVLFIRQTVPVHYEIERFLNRVRALHIGEKNVAFRGIDFGDPTTLSDRFGEAVIGGFGCGNGEVDEELEDAVDEPLQDAKVDE